MMYHYKSPIGSMYIRYETIYKKYALIILDDVHGHYLSPVAAADDVYTFTTGCSEWDDLDGTISAPTDIGEWDRML